MPLSFTPRLVNGPFDDPGLFIPFLFENRAFLFDLGDITALASRDILKISHIFVSHTHMDHFAGFDRLLRLMLGREKEIFLFGPNGFLNNIEGKLAGYSWDLVNNFSNQFSITASEIHPDGILTRSYHCRNRFIPEGNTVQTSFSGILLKEPAISVSALFLDHSIPALGFSIEERVHVNINKEALTNLGLETGPWLANFKQALFNNTDPGAVFEINAAGKSVDGNTFVLGDLAEKIAHITQGQKITYIADTVYNEQNAKKMIAFAKRSDHLFIESAFLEKDADIAKTKHHLTARQAGDIAGQSGVKRFTLFHFSPRYSGQEQLMQEEADEAYRSAIPNR